MATTTQQKNKRLAALLVIGAMILLTFLLAFTVSCAPSESVEDPSSRTEENADSDMNTKPVDWTMQSDCAVCHTHEADSMSDTACPQAYAHQDIACIECHTDEGVLTTAHEGITYGDKPASKATVVTVDSQTCIDCHGGFDEMATETAGSTALTDDQGTSVNPHELQPGERHEANAPTCTSCHKTHSENLSKDSMKFCAQCHHRGVFTCGNCHEIR